MSTILPLGAVGQLGPIAPAEMTTGTASATRNGAPPDGETATPFPRTRKRRLSIDEGTVVKSVLRRADELGRDANREKWMTDRLNRYAKYRGWLEEKTYPWDGCSNIHIPLLQTAELRQNAGLHNIAMTLRPLMSAKATSRSNIDREDAITNLLDAQLFIDPGPEMAERRIGDFISCFLQDGNAVAYTPWIRSEDKSVIVRHIPAPPADAALVDYLPEKFTTWFPTMQRTPELHAEKDNVFYVSYREGDEDREAEITVTEDDDGALTCVVTKPVINYDGPIMLPLDADSLLVPTRCTNLQPVAPWNPDGAPYVFVIATYRLDTIRRMKDSGDFNWLDDEAMEHIEAVARTSGSAPAPDRPGEEMEQQKDIIEGREHEETVLTDEDLGHRGVDLYLCFDRWDVDDDGLAEDVFWVVARDAEILCEARLLTEKWPSERPYRPLAEAIAIPVPGRWYGISVLELGESMHDLIKGTFDQSFDGWTMATLPWFMYSASSKLDPDITTIAPGQGVRTPGNPKDTVLFPNMPQRDVSGALGIIGLANQFFERVMMQGDLQLGRVPQGKASALRTYGTTSAILQQGDVRADQMLIRLFGGLREVARNFHRMNRHYLPPGKEVRIIGYEGPAESAYRTIEPSDIDADVDFDFRPDFMLSNPEMLGQALQQAMGVVVTPMMFQLGATSPTHVYRLIKDFLRAKRLDPKLYIMPPTGGTPILAAEAIGQIMQGRLPQGQPLEDPEEHLKTFMEWTASPEFGLLAPQNVQLARAWMEMVAQKVQMAKTMGAAGQFQQSNAQGGPPGGQGVPPGTPQAPGTPQGPPSGQQGPIGSGNPSPGGPTAEGGPQGA